MSDRKKARPATPARPHTAADQERVRVVEPARPEPRLYDARALAAPRTVGEVELVTRSVSGRRAVPVAAPSDGGDVVDEFMLVGAQLQRVDSGVLEDRKVDEARRFIDFIISTDDIDSYGTIVDQSSWKLERFGANPVVLFNHNTGPDRWLFGTGEKDIDRLPIACAERTRVEAGKLRSRAVFPAEGRDERSDKVWNALMDGRLNAASVGFRPGRAEKDEKLSEAKGSSVYRLFDCELYEWSVVVIPANPEAVAQRAARFLRHHARALGMSVDPNPAATSAATVAAPLAPPTPPPSTETPAPAEVRHATETVMDPILLAKLAKRFKCPADLDSVTAQLQLLTDERAETLGSTLVEVAREMEPVLEALSLAKDAPVADALRAVNALSTEAGKVVDLTKELTELRGVHDALQGEIAKREVDWIIRHGSRYGTPASESSRRSLATYRKHDPQGFAADYKVALDGLRAFDDTGMFDRLTAPAPDGKRADAPAGDGAASAPPSTLAVRASEDEFDRRVDSVLKANPGWARSAAMDHVMHGRDISSVMT